MLVLLLGGCVSLEPADDWQDALEPGGPCRAFDLTDGVVAGDNTELHAAFDCLNRQGTVQPLARLDVALDGATRSGNVGGAAVSALSALAGQEGLSLAGLLDGGLGLLDEREHLDAWLAIGLEWVYAAPAGEIGSGVSIHSQTSLDAGAVVPLLTTAGRVAAQVLDDGMVVREPVVAALRSAEAPRWVWSLVLAPDAPDPSLAALAADWPGVVADLLQATADSGNDHAPGPTGNSLRDSLSVVVAADGLPELIGVAAPILDDPHAHDAFAAWVEDEEGAGRLTALDDAAAHLAQVDAAGAPVQEGDDTALVSLVRVLHDANRPIECRVDLLVTDLEVDLGNLAVAILEAIAALDPDTAVDGVGVLGAALDFPLTDALLDVVADSGTCPVIDAQFVDDLHAVDRLADPEAEPLLRALIGLLGALDDHIDTVADVATTLHELAWVEPAQEVLLDVAGRSSTDTILAALPAVFDPDLRVGDGFPAGVRAVDVGSVVELLVAVGEADTWRVLQPPLAELVGADPTWDAVTAAARLLAREGTATAGVLIELRTVCDADPALPWLALAADAVEDDAVARPALELVESAAVRQALGTTSLEDPGPLPWLADLRRSGTLDLLLDTLTLFRPMLGGSDA